MKTITLALLFTLSAGCAETEPLPTSAIPPDLKSCETLTDCVVVELGCCDACNGGFLGAFNLTATMDDIEAYRATCDGQIACTEIACGPPTVDCVDQVCVASGGTL